MMPDYKTFARMVLDECMDWDGGSLQELAVKHGILKKVPYDPEAHGQHDYAEQGEPWYVFAEGP